MQAVQATFCRVEKKYMLTRAQHQALLAALRGRLAQDQYGLHTISNLYMDTGDFTLIRASIDKPVYKEKLRLRAYGVPRVDSTVFLELKKKCKGVVYKRRVPMAHAEAEAYLLRGERPAGGGQILREIDYFMDFYGHPTPRAFIAYDRVALLSEEEPGLRVTFDEGIRCRAVDLSLAQGAWGAQLLAPDQVLMEVKIPGAVPLWLCHVFADLGIVPTSYSKYGEYYRTALAPGHHSEGENPWTLKRSSVA